MFSTRLEEQRGIRLNLMTENLSCLHPQFLRRIQRAAQFVSAALVPHIDRIHGMWHLYGLDMAVDNNLQVYILELNYRPDFVSVTLNTDICRASFIQLYPKMLETLNLGPRLAEGRIIKTLKASHRASEFGDYMTLYTEPDKWARLDCPCLRVAWKRPPAILSCPSEKGWELPRTDDQAFFKASTIHLLKCKCLSRADVAMIKKRNRLSKRLWKTVSHAAVQSAILL